MPKQNGTVCRRHSPHQTRPLTLKHHVLNTCGPQKESPSHMPIGLSDTVTQQSWKAFLGWGLCCHMSMEQTNNCSVHLVIVICLKYHANSSKRWVSTDRVVSSHTLLAQGSQAVFNEETHNADCCLLTLCKNMLHQRVAKDWHVSNTLVTGHKSCRTLHHCSTMELPVRQVLQKVNDRSKDWAT